MYIAAIDLSYVFNVFHVMALDMHRNLAKLPSDLSNMQKTHSKGRPTNSTTHHSKHGEPVADEMSKL